MFYVNEAGKFYRILKPFAFGLAGADFVAFLQFVGDSRYPTLPLSLLIGTVPVLVLCGCLVGIFCERPPKDPRLRDRIYNCFAGCVVVTLLALADVLFSIKAVFAIAFVIGTGIAAMFFTSVAKKLDD